MEFPPLPDFLETPWYDEFLAWAAAAEAGINAASSPVVAPPAPLAGVRSVDITTGVVPIEVHEGRLYGTQGATLKVSDDDGVTWTTVGTLPGGSPSRLAWTEDGELLFVGTQGVWRSTGWATPTTATWTQRVSISTPGAPGISPWGFDGNGVKFIATEYSGTSRTESRYVWISVDRGLTWQVVVDKATIDPTNLSHMHGVCYDPWADRFWLSHGHGDIKGLYWSDDDGQTWTKLGGALQPDAAPTTLCATEDGIVCGSDSGTSGMYGIPRVPADLMQLHWLARWPNPRDGVAGFATRSWRDPRTGVVITGFKSDFADCSGAIFAGSARAQAQIWTATPAVSTWLRPLITPSGMVVAAEYTGSVVRMLSSPLGATGSTHPDLGNVATGRADWATSTAAGTGAVAPGRFATAIGAKTSAGGEGATALGHGAAAGGVTATAVGNNAAAPGSTSVAVGSGATATGTYSTVMGVASGATGHGVAVGREAKATGADGCTAVGSGATASGVFSTALGRAAAATHGWATAIGQGVATTADAQVALGDRHIELLPRTTTPAAPSAGARLFLRTTGGKEELCVRFKSGAVQIIAAEL